MVNQHPLTGALFRLHAVEGLKFNFWCFFIYGSDAVAGVVNVVLVDGLERQTARVVAGAGVNGLVVKHLTLSLLAVVSVKDIPIHMH